MNHPDISENDLKIIMEVYLHSLLMFHHSCDKEVLNENNFPKMQAELKIDNDIPLVFAGLCYSLSFEEPQYYFNKDVMNEVCERLENLNCSTTDKFVEGLVLSQESFFAAINSYSNIVDIYNDLSEASYETEFKTKIFRNPIYIQ